MKKFVILQDEDSSSVYEEVGEGSLRGVVKNYPNLDLDFVVVNLLNEKVEKLKIRFDSNIKK